MAGFAYNRLEFRSSSIRGEGLSSAIAAKRSRSCFNSISWDRSRMLMTRTLVPLSSLGRHVHSIGVFVVWLLTKSCCVAEIGRLVLNALFSCAEMPDLLSWVSVAHSTGNDDPWPDRHRDPSNRMPSRLMDWTVRSGLRMRAAKGSPSRRSSATEAPGCEAALRRRYRPLFGPGGFIRRLVAESCPDVCRC